MSGVKHVCPCCNREQDQRTQLMSCPPQYQCFHCMHCSDCVLWDTVYTEPKPVCDHVVGYAWGMGEEMYPVNHSDKVPNKTMESVFKFCPDCGGLNE